MPVSQDLGLAKPLWSEWTPASTFDCFLRPGSEPTLGLDGSIGMIDRPKPEILN
jgi:hypothetical protein